jgi:hypothetical protein
MKSRAFIFFILYQIKDYKNQELVGVEVGVCGLA